MARWQIEEKIEMVKSIIAETKDFSMKAYYSVELWYWEDELAQLEKKELTSR